MLSEQIKNLRTAKGINQVELAKCLGVTKQSVSNWENENIMPSIDMLIKIAEYFGVTTDFLLGLSENHTLNTTGLNEVQISHIQTLINDIRGK
ncbi:helix-turn-helix transcriptional regulator [Treponema sp.]|uniref:helix-turn-helix transcriptional regulator n=1 Tax=Treponema sp. TaxID=166 RepID=UPI00298DEEFA|nr:helix-turn-helix transcriptional regulator [Treponema sp.]